MTPDAVLDHDLPPRSVDTLATPDGVGTVRDPAQGDSRFLSNEVEGPAETDKALQAAGLALVSGSTVAKGAIDRFIGLPISTIFYGVTVTGAAGLLDLERFCPCCI